MRPAFRSAGSSALPRLHSPLLESSLGLAEHDGTCAIAKRAAGKLQALGGGACHRLQSEAKIALLLVLLPSLLSVARAAPNCSSDFRELSRKNVSSFYPNFHVLGYAKCGTSFLYQFIKSHKQVQAAHKSKEHCFNTGSVMGLLRKRSQTPYSVNGCIAGPAQVTLTACLWPLLEFQPKYIISVREPADWLWAKYNYWTIAMDAELNPPSHWTTRNSYRSPELFHELVLAGSRVVIDTRGGSEHYGKPIVAKWIEGIQSASTLVGAVNLMVVNIDSPKSDPDFAAQLAAFLGLSNDFGLSPSRLINSGASYEGKGQRASKETAAKSTANEGLYEVSGWRPMLNATRSLIREREHPACVQLAQRFVALPCALP